MKHLPYWTRAAGLVVLGLVVYAPVSDAHFKLLEPASWLVEDARGNPQKIAPCGGTSADAGTPSGAVTAVRGGDSLHIKVEETVFHPGHYRIALARTRDGLPADPEATTRESERGPWSVSGEIMDPVRPPVIADGLFAHTERVAGPLETDIRIPNINCEGCTLQVIQFMAEHALNRDGDFSYHHCAVLNITADPGKPMDAGWM